MESGDSGRQGPTAPCRILRLPTELRVAIIETVFPFWAEPHYIHLTSTGDPFHEPPLLRTDLAIMRCCKTMYYESSMIFHENLVYFFHDYTRLEHYAYRFNVFLPLAITLRLEPDCAAVYAISTRLIEHLSDCNLQKLRFDVSLLWRADAAMTDGAFWQGIRLLRGLKEVSIYACPYEMQSFRAIEELEQSLQCATLPKPKYKD